MSSHSVYLCPRCKKPMVDGKCWQCGYNTASYEEDMNACKPKDVWVSNPTIKVSEYEPIIFEARVIDKTGLTGGSSSYYQLPEGCKELQDLIEYKNMNFARGNVFKAAYRLGDKPGTDQIYDWEKIIWFAQREIKRLKKDV